MPIPDVVGENQAKRRRRRNPKRITGRPTPGLAQRVRRTIGRQQTVQRARFRMPPRRNFNRNAGKKAVTNYARVVKQRRLATRLRAQRMRQDKKLRTTLLGLDLADTRGRAFARSNLYGHPALIDKANYAGHYERLWGKAHGFYPGAGKMPPLRFDDSLPGLRGRVRTDPSRRDEPVYIHPGAYARAGLRPSSRQKLSQALKSPNPKVRAYAREEREQRKLRRATPVHEWAHVFQGGRTLGRRPQTYRDYEKRRARVEGGAQAFTYYVAPKVGLPIREGHHSYDPFVKQVRRRRGRRWIRSGQFR